MSDLHCAATLLLVPYGEARDLAPALRSARVAHVWTATTEAAQHAAHALAADLRVGVSAIGDLDGSAPSGAVLGEIADQHRGETAVVVVDRGDSIIEVAIDGDGSVRRPWSG